MKTLSFALIMLVSSNMAQAETLTLQPTAITEWKAVQARVESRDVVPARARIGGVIEELSISEGDLVTAGQQLGLVKDDKIAFQIAAQDAQLAALSAQLATAEAELQRGETLVSQGVVTRQRLAQLSTDVEVIRNQIAATQASRAVLTQQETEGAVIAPADGRVLTVPATRGSVIMPGEPVATIGSGGFFLRLAVPERFAGDLQAGAEIPHPPPKAREAAGRSGQALSADRQWKCVDRRCRRFDRLDHRLRQCPHPGQMVPIGYTLRPACAECRPCQHAGMASDFISIEGLLPADRWSEPSFWASPHRRRQ